MEERIQSLENHVNSLQKDVLDFNTRLARVVGETTELNQNIKKLEARVEELRSASKTEIARNTRRFLAYFSSGFALLLVFAWSLMWAFEPFRLGIWNLVNAGLKVDEYIAYRLNEKDSTTKKYKSSLGERVSKYLLNDPDFFERIVALSFPHSSLGERVSEYLLNDSHFFESIVALSFPHSFDRTYRQDRETVEKMVFYANKRDTLHLTCQLSFTYLASNEGKDLPHDIHFFLNESPLPSLTIFPAQTTDPSKTYHRSFDIQEAESALKSSEGRGIQSLEIRISKVDKTTSTKLADGSEIIPGIKGDCFVAVIGKADASRMLDVN